MASRRLSLPLLVSIVCALLLAAPAALADTRDLRNMIDKPTLSVPVPNLQLSNLVVTNVAGQQRLLDVPWIGEYVKGVYSYAVSIAGILAGVMFIVGGFQYLTAGGDTSRVSKAKDRIKDALIGLFLTFGAFIILNTVSPALTSFESLSIKAIKREPFIGNETPANEIDPTSGATLPPSAPTGPLTPTSIRHFAQCGSVGAGIPYTDRNGRCPTRPDGSRFTVCTSGCGIASAAMVIGSLTGREPSTLARELATVSSTGGCRPCRSDCSDCSGTNMNCLVRDANIGRYGVTGRSISGRTNIETELRAGRSVVAVYGRSVFTNNGHFVVLAAINPDGTIRVLDPGKNQSPYNYSCEQIRRSSATATCPMSSDRMDPAVVFGTGLNGTWALAPR